jgi:hypothetical protein
MSSSKQMKTKLISLVAGLAILSGNIWAQEKTERKPAQDSLPAPAQGAAESPKLTAAELEANFKATLTKATMSGRWCSIDNGKLGPEKEDKYSILSVTKMGGDAWLINARIQYNKKDFVAPVPVLVKWAGDTPVLIVDKFPMPSGGVFSARVLIYDHTYAGTWSGGDHAGLLSGTIANEAGDKSESK